MDLDAANKVFASQGYDATTVRDLEEATGTSRGELFVDYQGKRELYLAGIQRLQLQGIVPAAARAMSESTSAEQLLRGMLEPIREWHREHPEATQLFQQVTRNEAAEPDLAQLNEAMDALLAGFVGNLQRRGVLNDTPEPSAIVSLIHQLLDWVYAETAHLSAAAAQDLALPSFSVLLEGDPGHGRRPRREDREPEAPSGSLKQRPWV